MLANNVQVLLRIELYLSRLYLYYSYQVDFVFSVTTKYILVLQMTRSFKLAGRKCEHVHNQYAIG